MSATCAVCGHDFEARRSDARYCSPTCRQRGLRRGERVHADRLNVTVPHSDTSDDPNGASALGAEAETALPRRARPLVVPEVEPCRSPVYAHGSLHGPVYDAKGNPLRSPVPSVVGYLTPDGRFERDHKRAHGAAEGAAR